MRLYFPIQPRRLSRWHNPGHQSGSRSRRVTQRFQTEKPRRERGVQKLPSGEDGRVARRDSDYWKKVGRGMDFERNGIG